LRLKVGKLETFLQRVYLLPKTGERESAPLRKLVRGANRTRGRSMGIFTLAKAIMRREDDYGRKLSAHYGLDLAGGRSSSEALHEAPSYKAPAINKHKEDQLKGEADGNGGHHHHPHDHQL
jgi:hypothetical protein